jgi:UDP:flavonoid glycosyltransferase YjiC (YdhE family)
VIVPLFADQFANSPRVAQVGAGVVIDPHPNNDGRGRGLNDDDATRIAESIKAIRIHSSYREQARRTAAEMAAAPSADALLAELLGTG